MGMTLKSVEIERLKTLKRRAINAVRSTPTLKGVEILNFTL